MDESKSPPLRGGNTTIVSLTGIILTPSKCIAVRDSFLKSISPHFIKEDGQRIDNIPEIHGSKMLPDATDDEKLKIYSAIAQLPEKHGFSVYRVGYYVTPEFKRLYNDKGQAAIGLSWMNLLNSIKIEYENNYLVPVMDSLNWEDIQKYSGMLQLLNSMRTAGHEKSLSISNSQNILGEVFFADSRFSILTQIVDVISYLRCINDQKEEGLPFSTFKESVYNCNSHLTNKLQCDVVIDLNKFIVDRKRKTITKSKKGV